MSICALCGIEFSPSPHSTGKYCSTRCYHAVPKKREDPANRFWKFVNKSAGCWEWSGARKGKGKDGYGSFRFQAEGHKNIGAHRFSWMIHFGAIPDGMQVLHQCDNPPCVRPEHLFLGTDDDNREDKIRKGRQGSPDKRGERHHMHKLTEAQVLSIRLSHANGNRITDLSKEYGITPGAIHGIVSRRIWKHI